MARSDAHLRRFIPFTTERARTLDEMVPWLRQHRALFDQDLHYRYAVFDRAGDVLLGEAMLLDRTQEGEREVGYWTDASQCGRGYATEAAAAVVALAFELDGVAEVTLSCSPANLGSVGVARKLGFQHLETVARPDPVSPDDREKMCWTLTRAGYGGSLAAELPLRALDALGRPLIERP